MCDYGVSVMKREAWEAAIMDAQPAFHVQRICQLPKISMHTYLLCTRQWTSYKALIGVT